MKVRFLELQSNLTQTLRKFAVAFHVDVASTQRKRIGSKKHLFVNDYGFDFTFKKTFITNRTTPRLVRVAPIAITGLNAVFPVSNTRSPIIIIGSPML